MQAHGILPVSVPGFMVECEQRRWKVEEWTARRDLYPTLDLWQECLGDTWPMDAQTLLAILDRQHPTPKHFVVRESKGNKLLGFAATFAIQSGVGGEVFGNLACLMVLPSRRNLGIGLSLHDHSMRYLRTGVHPSLKRVQLGSIFPRLWPGLPTDIPRRQHAWFRHRGWNLPPYGQGNCYDGIVDLTTFQAPIDVIQPHQEAGITFRRATMEEFDKIMEFESANWGNLPGWIQVHQSTKESGLVEDIMVAVDKEGNYLASAIAYLANGDNPISSLFAWPRLIGIFSLYRINGR
jgi:beta-N-acetylhexosaminidase